MDKVQEALERLTPRRERIFVDPKNEDLRTLRRRFGRIKPLERDHLWEGIHLREIADMLAILGYVFARIEGGYHGIAVSTPRFRIFRVSAPGTVTPMTSTSPSFVVIGE